jgi:hypothetical protein
VLLQANPPPHQQLLPLTAAALPRNLHHNSMLCQLNPAARPTATSTAGCSVPHSVAAG